MYARMLVLGVTAVVGCRSTPAPHAPPLVAESNLTTWSPDGTTIAFERRIAGDYDIHVMAADGSNVRRLTTAHGDEGEPAWSPDGRHIVFTGSFGAPTPDIYLMTADGDDLTRVTSLGRRLARPSFSADGRRIVFNARTDDGTREIFVVTIDGTGLEQLTDAAGHSDWAWWAPDGSMIHFESDRDGPWESYVMLPDGSGQRRLTHTQINAPVANPVNGRLAGQGIRDDNWEILTTTPDGTREVNVTRHVADDRLPAWSPDGQRIAFTSNRTGYLEIFVMNADGSGLAQLTRQPDGAIDPTDTLRAEGVAGARRLIDALGDYYAPTELFIESAANGVAYERLGEGRIDEAIEIFRFNVQLYPESANVHDSLGEALATDGQTEEAIESYERALAIDPTNAGSRAALEKLRP